MELFFHQGTVQVLLAGETASLLPPKPGDSHLLKTFIIILCLIFQGI
jgi:hypothetical protein